MPKVNKKTNWELVNDQKRQASQFHRDITAIPIDPATPVAEIVAKYNVHRATAYRAKKLGYLCPTYHNKTTAPPKTKTPRTKRPDNPTLNYIDQQTINNYDALRAIAGKTWQTTLRLIMPQCYYEDYMDYFIDQYFNKPCPHTEVYKYAKVFAVRCALQFRDAYRRRADLKNLQLLPDTETSLYINDIEITNVTEVYQQVQNSIIEQHGQYKFATVWKWANNRRQYKVTKQVRQILDNTNF